MVCYCVGNTSNRILIDTLAMKSIYFMHHDDFEAADQLILRCYPLENTEKVDEFGIEWPFGGLELSDIISKEHRVELYRVLLDLLNKIDSKIIFEMLMYQMRCNGAVFLIRKREYDTAYRYLTSLSYNDPYIDQKILDSARYDFREKKQYNLEVQIFDDGTLFHYLGLIAHSQKKYDEALDNYEESLIYRRKSGHYLDKFEVCANLGSVSLEIYEYSPALEYYIEALEIAKEKKLNNYIVGIKINIGIIYQYDFDFDNALQVFSEAYKLSLQLNKDYQSRALKHLGKTYQYLGKINEAIKCFEKSLDLYIKLQKIDINDLAYLYYNLILMYNRSNKYNQSINLLNKFSGLKLNNKIDFDAKLMLSYLDYNYHTKQKNNQNQVLQLIEFVNSNKLSREINIASLLQLLRLDLSLENDQIYQSLSKNKEFVNFVKQSNNPSLICYLIIKQKKKLNGLEVLINKLKLIKQNLESQIEIEIIDNFLKSINLSTHNSLSRNIIELIDINLTLQHYELNIYRE